MTRERVVDEKRRLICAQKAILKATRENDFIALTEAVAMITLVVSALMKELEE